MVSQEFVHNLIEEKLKPTHLTVEDFSCGCGSKFNCVIVSSQFEGKPLLERHRMVHSALGDTMGTIHALTLKTYTNEQFEKISNKS
ncbi:uncharacterized protein LOC128388075 [Panonychus citri]|uniref:uncharacterized protein LOC128388075 n=1 Tax=Panonychus citri TaxID=50023 RepID=UPI002306EC26|nr:uncharacterized protein LOC128388075 [Panonychus citri]